MNAGDRHRSSTTQNDRQHIRATQICVGDTEIRAAGRDVFARPPIVQLLGGKMTTYGPLDQLPFYATDDQLARAIVGIGRVKEWKQFVALYEHQGFPKVHFLLGGRYIPAVKKFLDLHEGVSDLPNVWPARDGKEDLSVWNTRRQRRRQRPKSP